MSPNPKRIAIVCDFPLLRHGMTQVINAAPDLRTLEDFDRNVAIRDGEASEEDVVVIHLDGPTHEATERIGQLSEQGYSVIVLSSSDGQFEVDMAFQAGARGYLSKTTTEADFLTAIRAVASGRNYVSASFARPAHPIRISGRERQILEFIAGGATDREIAEKLNISEHTVHSHLDRLREKTGSRRRADLIRLALEHGVT